jgi:Resolvase, N terminal domain
LEIYTTADEINSQPVIMYRRVSTRRQGESGISLDAQEVQVREFAATTGSMIMEQYQDVHSARNEGKGCSRPGFKQAVARSLQTGWPIIVASPDRFSRTVQTYDKFVSAGGRAYPADKGYLDATAMRAAIVRAESDGDNISKRTLAGQERARAKSNPKKPGNPRIADARALGNQARARKLRERREQFRIEHSKARDAGAPSDGAVAKIFNNNSYATPQGRLWTADNVAAQRRAIEEEDRATRSAVSCNGESDIFGTDSKLTPAGRDRLRAALVAKGKDESYVENLDRTISNEAFDGEQARHLTDWIIRSELTRAAGITTPVGLPNGFNEKSYTAERGRTWTGANDDAMLRKSMASPASVAVAEEPFTSDHRLTEAGVRQFRDALAELGADEKQLRIPAMLKGQVLADAHMNAIKDKIERAEASRRAKRLEQDKTEVEETVRQLPALSEEESLPPW